jgi:hypothetical protein
MILIPLGFVTPPAVAALPLEPFCPISPAAGFENLIGSDTTKTQTEAGNPMTRNRHCATNSGSLAGLPPSGGRTRESGALQGPSHHGPEKQAGSSPASVPAQRDAAGSRTEGLTVPSAGSFVGHIPRLKRR